MHNEHGPPPCHHGLNAVPKFVFARFARVRKAKDTLLWTWRLAQCAPSIRSPQLPCAKSTTWTRLISKTEVEPILVTSKICSYLGDNLAIIRRSSVAWVPINDRIPTILGPTMSCGQTLKAKFAINYVQTREAYSLGVHWTKILENLACNKVFFLCFHLPMDGFM